MNDNNEPDFLTTREAAEISRRSVKGLRNRRYLGLPPRSVLVGGRLLYPREDFEAWMRGDLERKLTSEGTWVEVR